MRALTVNDTAVGLMAQTAPFLPGYTVVVINDTAGSLVLQESDVIGSGYTTLATVPAHTAQEVTLDKQFIKVSTAANLMLLGN